MDQQTLQTAVDDLNGAVVAQAAGGGHGSDRAEEETSRSSTVFCVN